MRHREREWGRIFSSSRMAPARRAATCPTRRAATSTSCFAPPASRRTPRSIPSQQIRILRRRPRFARFGRRHQDQVVAPHLQLPGSDDGPRHHAEHHRLLCRDHPRLAAGRPHLSVRLQPRRLHGAVRRRRAEILRRADRRRLPGHGADPAAAARSQVGAAHCHRGGQARLPARQFGQARSLSRRARGPRRTSSAPSTAAVTRRHPTPRPTSSACGTRWGRSAQDRSFLPCWPAST